MLLLLILALQDARVEKDVRVAMPDGVRLATDVHLPAGPGPFPVILARTPYNKNGEKGNAAYFVKHGYAYVAQDTRGRYGSEGVWSFLGSDGPDGLHTVNWIAKQPWSSGKVGTIGTSYVGGTQHALAMEKPEALATCIPVDAVSNMGRQSMRNAGAFELRFWNWVMLNSVNGSKAAEDPATKAVLKEMADHRLKYLAQLPLRRGTTPLKLAADMEDWLVEAMRHGADDGYWDAAAVAKFPERYKDIPVYLVGGWYDSWAGNTTSNYLALSKRFKSPVHLIMGPWIHGRQGASSHGQVDFGPDAAIRDPLAWRLAWYDRWLKNDASAPLPARVRIFTMGTGDGRRGADGKLLHGGAWRDESDWPPADCKPVRFHLRDGGRLAREAPDVERSSTSFVFDPKNPVPTIGGGTSSNDGLMLQGAWDQKGGPHVWNWTDPLPLSARNDVLVFATAPLAEDVEVTGELEVHLWATSSAPDTDFTAKLLDVYPPSPDFPGGFDLNLTDGIVRARFRDSLEKESLLEPGKPYRYTIRLYPTSNVFKKGHRIRVDVSSSNFPRFDVNPNTGEPLAEHRRSQAATNTILHDREHPSHIALPVRGK